MRTFRGVTLHNLTPPILSVQVPDLLLKRRATSRDRLDELRRAVAELDELARTSGFCIYVTGSYGREEAGDHSDLDLFFVHEGTRDSAGLTAIRETLIKADLIRLNRERGFPEFSGDGQYLQTHALDDVVGKLGGPDDDHANLFTARLLLLLESRPVYDDAVYERTVRTVIDTYFRDYPDHAETFRPLFLVNDVLRFWKTLCLNYEHRRHRRDGDARDEVKSHLKNLKLKFSRLTTCFSGILPLVQHGTALQPEQAFEILRPAPTARLEVLGGENDKLQSDVERLLNDYAWFLEATGKPEVNVLDWFTDKRVRDDAFSRAKDYGDTMFRVLQAVVADQPDTLRYLVV